MSGFILWVNKLQPANCLSCLSTSLIVFISFLILFLIRMYNVVFYVLCNILNIDLVGLLSTNGGSTSGNSLVRASPSNPLVQLDTVERDVASHVQEIESKVLTIVSSLLSVQLDRWEVKPPVPSQPFRNISR